MLSTWSHTWLIKIITLILSLGLIHGGNASAVCEDPTWPDDLIIARRDESSVTTLSESINSATQTSISTTSSVISNNSSASSTSSSPTASPLPDLFSRLTTGPIPAGEINCRSTAITGDDVNYYTCTQLARRKNIEVETFFLLNPEIDPDCGNIKPNTVYCVRGFIEPVRSKNGECGPPNNNATCIGYESSQCCNSETWTCGNSTADCADGTCYEGLCYGDAIFSTDGTCGSINGNRQCRGNWGECCNVYGRCGSGDAFCAYGNCHSGNCIWPATEPQPLPYFMRGNTTDGTCGAASGFSCTVSYGFCCNKDGMCGALAADCGDGCQPDWGDCNNVTSSTSSRTTTKSTSKSITSSSVSVTSSVSATFSTSTISKASTTASTTLPAISSLPSCGQTCFSNVIAQYAALGCSTPDPSCMCSNVNFGYGIRDCSNAVCTATDASTVIAYESLYCAKALATGTVTATSISTSTTITKATTATAATTDLSSLPTCGQTCFNNMLAQYSILRCTSPNPSCLCSNVNFQYGLRDCANGACGTTVGATVIAYGSAYCAAATVTTTVTSIAPATTTALSSLPTCGQTCFNNMLAQYSALGCTSANAACLCNNVNFQYGLRDCSNGACGTAVASTVIAYGSAYCAAATATAKA